MILTTFLLLLAALIVIAGLAGLAFPALPGAPLLFAGLLLAAWAEDFVYVGSGTLIALAVMAALTYVLDFIATALGAQRYGASTRAIIGAMLGAIVGLFFGLPGILLGPLVGAIIGELTARSDLRHAARAGFGAFIGLLLSIAGKLALGCSMIGLYLFVRYV